MKHTTLKLLLLAGAVALSAPAMATPAVAGEKEAEGASGERWHRHRPHLTQEQRDALHACAEKGGVTLPKRAPGEPRPELTDAQHQVIKKCFETLGIPKPPHPPGPPPQEKE